MPNNPKSVCCGAELEVINGNMVKGSKCHKCGNRLTAITYKTNSPPEWEKEFDDFARYIENARSERQTLSLLSPAPEEKKKEIGLPPEQVIEIDERGKVSEDNNSRPAWACKRWGDWEHDWIDCPDCTKNQREFGID